MQSLVTLTIINHNQDREAFLSPKIPSWFQSVAKCLPVPNPLETTDLFSITMFRPFPGWPINGIIQYVAFKSGCFHLEKVINALKKI